MDSRYTPIPQKNYHCVPACVQMIMHKHGLNVPSQDLLGYNLGVVVPQQEATHFNPVRTGQESDPEVGVGTQLAKPEYDFNKVAKRLGLGIGMTVIPPTDFASPEELTEYLGECEHQDRDIIVCYDFSTMYHNGRNGHVNLFDRVVSEGEVRLIEPIVVPGHETSLWRKTNAGLLLRSMIAHSEWMGGVWEFEQT